MKSEPNPNAQMPAGKARHAAGLLLGDSRRFEDGECKGRKSVGSLTPGISGAPRHWR